MKKLRKAQYCNIKLLLIFLVIYGHLIEPQSDQSVFVAVQYKCIYFFHIPAFAFLSGLFIRDYRTCAIQLRKTAPLYAILQALLSLFSGGMIDIRYPCWILWYLLSLSFWLCFALVWMKFAKGKGRIAILMISVAIGCAAGYVDFIDRRFSFSRTLVFFPYFWLGFLLHGETKWKKFRRIGIDALFFGLSLAVLIGKQLPVDFLYHAEPYGLMENGAALRLVCYLIGACAIFFLLAFVPDRRFAFTVAGADTMPVYILHGVFAIVLRELLLPWYVCLLLAAGILWALYRVTKKADYVIIEGEV